MALNHWIAFTCYIVSAQSGVKAHWRSWISAQRAEAGAIQKLVFREKTFTKKGASAPYLYSLNSCENSRNLLETNALCSVYYLFVLNVRSFLFHNNTHQLLHCPASIPMNISLLIIIQSLVIQLAQQFFWLLACKFWTFC